LAAGFHGFISKQWSDIKVLRAITDILSDRIYVPPSCTETGNGNALDVRFNGSAAASSLQARFRKLTKRQLEVLALLAHGRSNKEIARALCVAETTTKTHVAGLLPTLGVRNITEAIFTAANLVNLAEADSTERSAARASPAALSDLRRAVGRLKE
jgi:DNA-binding NarL/FixJ family response regulator